MRRYRDQRYQFDRLFMSHLSSKLRPEYEPLVTSLLPEQHWMLLLELEVTQATSSTGAKHPVQADLHSRS